MSYFQKWFIVRFWYKEWTLSHQLKKKQKTQNPPQKKQQKKKQNKKKPHQILTHKTGIDVYCHNFVFYYLFSSLQMWMNVWPAMFVKMVVHASIWLVRSTANVHQDLKEKLVKKVRSRLPPLYVCNMITFPIDYM